VGDVSVNEELSIGLNVDGKFIEIRAMGRLTALSAWIPDRSPGWRILRSLSLSKWVRSISTI